MGPCVNRSIESRKRTGSWRLNCFNNATLAPVRDNYDPVQFFIRNIGRTLGIRNCRKSINQMEIPARGWSSELREKFLHHVLFP